MNHPLKFWLITVAAVLGVGLTASLGQWQLSRAAQKQALQVAVDSNANLPGLNGSALVALSDPLRMLHRAVSLRGRWVADRTIFLDNRQMNARPGFYVVTPMQLEGSAVVVLVQRGWVPRNFVDRSAIPAVPTTSGWVELQGRIAPPPAKLYELGIPAKGVIRQNLDIGEFGVESGLPLMPVSIRQTGTSGDVSGDGLLRDWPEASAGVDKHHGYAFQWFGLSALIAVLYVWFQIVRKFFHPSAR